MITMQTSCVAEVEHGCKHFDRMIPSVEDLAVLHRHLAVVRADYENWLLTRVLGGVLLLNIRSLLVDGQHESERRRVVGAFFIHSRGTRAAAATHDHLFTMTMGQEK